MSKPPKDPSPTRPRLGLVCITSSGECRFRIITRSRYLAFSQAQREQTLIELYWDNLSRLQRTLGYCDRHGIALYRMTSDLFPMSDDPLGQRILHSMSANLSAVGRRTTRLGIRLLMHPDQFVVLNSESPAVVENSRAILAKQAMWFDLMGLPQSAWAPMNVHGGKAGRGEALVETIRSLPENVHNRLTLENDEHVYGAAEILDLCQRAGVPMVFDAHHHAVKEKLGDYDHPSVAQFTEAARATWPDPAWQIVHLSNGSAAFCDPKHSDLIEHFPRAFQTVPWIEVEAKGKERAIGGLRERFPELA